MRVRRHFLFLLSVLLAARIGWAQTSPKFNVLALYENGGHHVQFSAAAKTWLDQLAADSAFAVDYIQNTSSISKEYLKHYQLFIQLDFPPYQWGDLSKAAFEDYIQNGRGGWIGFHHATLLGEFDGYAMWPWFSDFLGGIRFKNYIATFAKGTLKIEDSKHPIMKDIHQPFIIEKEEWYTYNKTPRPNVHVIASVDEDSYQPASEIRMGDHPVIWTNEKMKARNVYIFMGHSPDLFANEAYCTLFRNAIFWAAKTSGK